MLAECPGCRARYRVPDAAGGKRTRCKKCGQAFRIPSGAAGSNPPAASPSGAGLADSDFEHAGSDLEALASGTALERPATAPPDGLHLSAAQQAGTGLLEPPARHARHRLTEDVLAAATPYARYFAYLAQSPGFLARPAHVFTFVVLWMLLAAREVMQTATGLAPFFLGGFFGAGAFIISGWYMAFKLNVVVSAAGEASELPGLSAEDGWWDGVVVPFCRMLAAYGFALLPALIFVLVVRARMSAALAASGADGLNPSPGSAAGVVVIILGIIGLFFWPMMVLIVACGNSVAALFRLDLMLATIARSLPAYLVTVVAVYIAWGAQGVVTGIIWARLAQTANWREDVMTLFALPAVFTGVSLFFDVIAMRAIGYYYSCFKHKFAWSWG